MRCRRLRPEWMTPGGDASFARADLSPHLPNGVAAPTIGALPAPWRVSRVSESPCTETGRRRQVSRLAGPACRQTATETRETCPRKPKTPARCDSNSGNLPQSRENAARRLGNPENPPPRAGAAPATRKTRHLRHPCVPPRQQQPARPGRLLRRSLSTGATVVC